MPEFLSTPRYPCALGGGLEQDAGRRALGKDRRAPHSLGVDALMQDLPGCGEETNLALIFVHIDANMFYGWAPRWGALTVLIR